MRYYFTWLAMIAIISAATFHKRMDDGMKHNGFLPATPDGWARAIGAVDGESTAD